MEETEKTKDGVEQEEEGKQEAEKPEGDSKGGNKPKTPQNIIEANAAAERMEKAAEKLEKAEKALQDGEIRRRLSGETEAGTSAVPKSEDEQWAEDAKKRYAGTGLDPTPDDTPTTFS